MSVRLLIPGAALRLDRDRHDASRVLARSPRQADLAAVFPDAWIVDRPDQDLRYRAYLPLGTVLRAFGPALTAGLSEESVPSPEDREVARRIDGAFATLRDERPIPTRVPVLRSDLAGASSPHRLDPSPSMERERKLRLPLSETEIARLRLGWMPRDPHDKWHLFFEEPWLYAHRHWSGLKIARFELRGGRLARAVLPIPAGMEDKPGYVPEMLGIALGAVERLIGRPPSQTHDPATAWQLYGPSSTEPVIHGLDPADLPIGVAWWDGPETRAVS